MSEMEYVYTGGISDLLNSDVWYASVDEVQRFGRDLLVSGYLEDHRTSADYDRADALLDYFDKPHHWNKQHAWWVANSWADDWEMWELGHNTNWEIT